MISVRLSQKSSEFQGVGMFGQMPFPFLGTIGAVGPGGGDRPAVAPVHAISVSQFGSINIDGSWVGGPQPHLDGMVTAMFADGSVHTADFKLVPAVIRDGASESYTTGGAPAAGAPRRRRSSKSPSSTKTKPSTA